jgi:hypothetical protein
VRREGRKRVHYGSPEESDTDAFDAWAQCHDPYEREDSQLTLNWKRVTCKRCLKRAPTPFRDLLLSLARGAG